MSNNQYNVNKRQHDGDDAEKEAKRRQYMYNYNDLIVVIVGTPEKGGPYEFRVHKDNICEKSNFFKAAVSTDRWREGQEKLVRLPDVSSKVFGAYVHWAYTNKVMPDVWWRGEFRSGARAEIAEYIAYISLYLLAEFLDDIGIRAEILDALVSKIDVYAQFATDITCRMIWEGTPKGSPLRNVALEWMIRRQHRAYFAQKVERFPKEFLEDFAVLLMQRTPSKGDGVETLEALAARMRAQLLSK